jgi:hypothetical protein
MRQSSWILRNKTWTHKYTVSKLRVNNMDPRENGKGNKFAQALKERIE